MKTCSRCGRQYADEDAPARCLECNGEFQGEPTAIFDGPAWRELMAQQPGGGAAAASEPPAPAAPGSEPPSGPPASSVAAAAPTARAAETEIEEAPTRQPGPLEPSPPPMEPQAANDAGAKDAGNRDDLANDDLADEPEPEVTTRRIDNFVRPTEAEIAAQPDAVAAAEVTVETTAQASPFVTAPSELAGDISDDQLAAIKASGRFTIGLLGYPASGKTWFLNRLKRRYERHLGRNRYMVDPGSVDQGKPVDSTAAIERHSFTCVDRRQRPDQRHGAKSHSFFIVDIPGERFLRAVENRFRGEYADGLIRALEVCDALVIMLPAEQLLAPPGALAGAPRPGPRDSASAGSTAQQLLRVEAEIAAQPPRPRRKGPERDAAEAKAQRLADRREALLGKADERRAAELDVAHQQLDTFVTAVVRLSAAASLLGKAKPSGEGSWTADDLLKVTDDEFQSLVEQLHAGDRTPPVYAALSKSDHINNRFRDFLQRRGLIIDLDDFDKDPGHVVRCVPEGLHRALTEAFSLCRFDFLTAFAEHEDGVNINYDLKDYGVEAVVDWIDWARRRERAPAWQRWDTAVVRTVKALRDAAAPAPLSDAADEDAEPPPAWRRMLGWPGRALAGAVDSAFAGSRLLAAGWTLGAVALAALAGAWLLGMLPFGLGGSAGAAPPITPRMVYPIEIERMAETSPLIDKGRLVTTLHPWSEAPSDGFLFSVGPTSPARQPLDQAMEQTRALEAAQPVSAADADRAIDRFKAADSALQQANGDDPARALVDYHEGLLDAWSGRYSDAVAHFNAVLDRVTKLRASPPADLSLPSKSRLTAVEAATRYALGVALLKSDTPDLAGAAAQFKQAAEEVGLTSSGAPTDADTSAATAALRTKSDFFYSFDPGATAVLDTSDLAADLVATDIQIDSSNAAAASKIAAEADMKSVLGAWSGDADEVGTHPLLAVNLVVAALRQGDPSAAARFAPQAQAIAEADRDEFNRLTSVSALAFGPALTNASDIPWPDKDWAYTRSWRTLFTTHAVANLQSSLQAAETTAGAPAKDADYLRRWQSQVVHLAALDAAGGARRDIVRAYAPLLDADDSDVLNAARAPFGPTVGALLCAVGGLALLLLLAAFWQVRLTYWRLFGARHRADRLKAQRA